MLRINSWKWTALGAVLFIRSLAQTPATIVFPNPTPNPSNLAADSYTRATTKINLMPGFVYGAVTAGATNLLNLNISSNPGYVSSAYIGSSTNPQTNVCSSLPATDPSKPVAETKGSFAVSPSGAALYDIPIFVSPGTRGIQPKLNINYNSQSGISLLGTQWSLSGISCIERTYKTPMHDGISKGPLLSNSDIFALDGNRLFGLSGTYGQNGATYYTEGETFATITSYNTSGNGPERFEVKDNGGNTLKYGLNNNSSLKGINNTTTLRWYLNEVMDEFGNYMRYYYRQLEGEVVIDHIDYTGNSTAQLAPYNSVLFSYIPLAEKASYHVNGVEFRKTQLLKQIRAVAGNDLVRQYVLDYTWNYGTYLSVIHEVDANGTELPATNFCWAKPNSNNGLFNQSTSIFANPNGLDYLNLQAVPADLDGDGFSDYVCYNAPGGSVRIMHNDFIGNMTTGNTIPFGTYFSNPNNLNSSSRVLSSTVADENKDNRQEVLSVVSDIYGYTTGNIYGCVSCPISTSYYVLKTSIDNTGTAQVVNLGSFSTNGQYNIDFSPSQFLFQVEDFTGEGDNDNLLITPDQISLRVSANTVYTYPLPNYLSIARPMSFNNDGVRDYIIMDNSNPTSVAITVITFNGSGFTTLYSNTFSFASGTTYFLNNFATGDINGDGIDELVYITPTRNELYVCKGDGTTFLSPQKLDIFEPLNNSGLYGISLSLSDVNNDGKADIITTDNSFLPSNSTSNNYFSYLSLGDLIIKGPSYAGNWSYTSATRTFYTRYATGNNTYFEGDVSREEKAITGNTVRADFNGDGITDITSFDSPGAERTITNNQFAMVRESISSITTGMKNRLEISYANLNSEISIDGPSAVALVYKKRSTTNYSAPLFNYKPNLYCVRQLRTLSGANQAIYNDTRYMYADGILHSKGRGFLGFEQVVSFDRFTGLGSLSINTFDTQYNIPLATELRSGKFVAQPPVNNITDYTIDNNTLISKVQMSYQVVARNGSGYLVNLTGKTVKDYLNSTKSTQAFSYDLNAGGRLASSTNDFGWSSVIRSTNQVNTYVLNNGSYKQSSGKTTVTQTGETPYERSESYYYDGQGHLTMTVNDQLVSALSSSLLTTSYSQFNSFGLPLSSSISGPNIATRNSLVVYDVTGRFITKATNPLGNFTESTFEKLYGNKIQEKDIAGLTSTYEYDGLGRMAASTSPTGVRSTVTYAWEAPVNYPYSPLGMYSVKNETEGSGYSKVYYSGGGEALRTESQDYAGQTVISDTKYNVTQGPLPCGVKLETTEPHYPSQQKYHTAVFDYETTYFRPSTQTTYSTSSGNASKVNTQVFTLQSYNPQSTDATYVAAYKKSSDQSLKSVTYFTNSAGQTVKIRNQSTQSDQNSVYAYTSCGKVKNMTLSAPAAPSQNILYSYVYNGLGQLSQSTDPSLGSQSFEYDVLGNLLKVTKPLGYFTYQYDALGRVTMRAGTLGSKLYSYFASGDGIQKIKSIVAPASTLEYLYDNFGRVKEEKETVTSSGRILKSNSVYDKYGRETQHTYPGGFFTKNTYNTMGVLTQIDDNANNLLWKLQDADAIGRIKQYDYGNGISTTQVYDDMNYLKEINHGSILQQQYSFYPITGNLKHRTYVSSAGTLKEVFSYDSQDRLQQSIQYNTSTGTYFNPNNVSFDVLGNITHKDDAGDLSYTGTGITPFAVQNITNATSNISLNTLNASYNVLDKVSQLVEMGSNKQMDFVYGATDDRVRMDYSINGTNQYTRYYAPGYDRQENGNTYKEWTYITAPTGLCAVYYNNNGNASLYRVLSDHLGSPLLLTDANQSVVEQYAFDSWGRRRNPADWSYSNIPLATKMIRGYTLHEMLDEFAMINMNARIYDPVIGRFVQADNVDQKECDLQGHNRYMYCSNNPLKYNDPTGHYEESYGSDPPDYGILNTLNVNFGIGFGTNGFHANFNLSFSKNAAAFNFAYGFGATYYTNFYQTGKSGIEMRNSLMSSYGQGAFQTSLGTNFWSGLGELKEFTQRTGVAKLNFGDFGLGYENDGTPFQWLGLGDGRDSYRTAAGFLQFKDLSLNLNLFTGLRDKASYAAERRLDDIEGVENGIPKGLGKFKEVYTHGFVEEQGERYRYGGLALKYDGITVGENSEWIRHGFQNIFAHDVVQPQRQFEMLSDEWSPIFDFSTQPILFFSVWAQ